MNEPLSKPGKLIVGTAATIVAFATVWSFGLF